jgi:hypothetical protein
MKKILNGERMCLFCGKEEKEHYEDYTKYYECDCSDAVEYRRIKNQIAELELKLPQPKFEITMKAVLYSKDE